MNSLHYDYIDRQQPVLLFLHGFLGSINQWQYVEEKLSDQFSILKIDLPGHGRSTEFAKTYTLIDLAKLIDQILVTENIERVHIIGHSMGGYLGAAFAKLRPKKTHSLTMVNSIAGKDPFEKRAMRDRSIKLIEKHQQAYMNMAIANLFTPVERNKFESRIKTMVKQATDISNVSIIQSLIAMRDREDSLKAIKELNVQVTYIYGQKDEVIQSKYIEQECEYLDIKGKIMNSGHMSLLTNVANILEYMHFVD